MTHYNQLHEVEEQKPCEHFELSVDIAESASKVTEKMQSNTVSSQIHFRLDLLAVVQFRCLSAGMCLQSWTHLDQVATSVEANWI